jgi:biotin carboxyl carrier protein
MLIGRSEEISWLQFCADEAARGKPRVAILEGDADSRLSEGDEAHWHAIASAHRGFQVGLELLLMIPRVGLQTGFSDIVVDSDLKVVFPERFLDSDLAKDATRALAPPPPASADEIVTPMGGAFFAREAPHLPLLADLGTHFEAGEPLFIIEVMKMFNKVLAPFSGTVTENLMSDKDGTIVKKGQTIFKIEPDERIEEESADVAATRVRETTLALL